MARYLVLVVALVACSFEPDYRDTRYDCAGRCPSGYECVDGHCEAPALDGGTVADASGAVDASVDAPVDGSEPDLTCDEQFGLADGYQLCSQTDDSCTFNATLDASSCDATCEALGGTCLSAQDSDSGSPCIDSGATTCGTIHNSVMCTCSR